MDVAIFVLGDKVAMRAECGAHVVDGVLLFLRVPERYLFGIVLISRIMRRSGTEIHTKAPPATNALKPSDGAAPQPSTSATRMMWWQMSFAAHSKRRSPAFLPHESIVAINRRGRFAQTGDGSPKPSGTNCVTGDQRVSKVKGWLGVGSKRLLLA